MNLIDHVKIYPMAGRTTNVAGASTFIDTQGAEGVLCIITSHSTKITSSGAITIRQCTGTSTAGAWHSTFSNKVILGTTRWVMAVDIVKPLRRYVQVQTLTCTGFGVLAIPYNLRRMGSTEARSYINASSNQPSGVFVCSS